MWIRNYTQQTDIKLKSDVSTFGAGFTNLILDRLDYEIYFLENSWNLTFTRINLANLHQTNPFDDVIQIRTQNRENFT